MAGTREWYEEIPSTQDRALELARRGGEEGTRVVARRQSRGRGRSDHSWESPTGGLYLSIVLGSPDAHAGLLPLALGAALAEELGERYTVPLAVKWPNDLLVAAHPGPSRKLAGLLIDRVPSPRLGTAAVAGIGLNVASERDRFPRELRDRVAVLSELREPPPGLDEVEAVVVDVALRTARSMRTPSGLNELRRVCRRRLFGVGRRASLDGRAAGTIVSVGDEGELWVEDRGERMAIRAGDLRVEEGA